MEDGVFAEDGNEIDLDEIKDEISEIDEKELEKVIIDDTILYSSLGRDSIENGSVSFRLPNRVGKFRVTILGVSKSGRYGTHTSFIQIQKPLNAILEYPQYIRQNDKIRLELNLQNNSE
jgi:hypothetical protein